MALDWFSHAYLHLNQLQTGRGWSSTALTAGFDSKVEQLDLVKETRLQTKAEML